MSYKFGHICIIYVILVTEVLEWLINPIRHGGGDDGPPKSF